MRFLGLEGINPVELMKTAVQRFLKHDLSTYAAALAYSALFSIFPFMIFLIALLSTLEIPQFFDWLLEQARNAMPADGYSVFSRALEGIQQQPRGGLMSVGIATAIWAASSAVRAVMNAMNVTFEVEEARPMLKRYVLSIVYTVGLAVLFTVSAGLIVAGPDAINWIADQAGFGDLTVTLWTWLRWPVLAILLTTAIAMIYYFAPNIDQKFRFISPGAMFAVVLWLIASVGFSFYVSNFADYSSTYGSLAGIIILLVFLYISSAIILLGAEVNAELERQRKSNGNNAAVAAA
jgi:membrane protein